MIHEVDDALRALLRAEVLEGAQIAVVFDAPTRDWAAKVNAPTVNLYLYDIREDMRRRERGLYNEYDEHGTVVARRRPPRFFKLSYLITAWTKRPEDEHRLLSSLLGCLLRYEALPPARLTGALGEIGVAVPMTIALPPPEDRSFADVWSALGGELKPSLDLVVSVPVTESPTYPAGPPVGDEGLHARFGDHAPEGRERTDTRRAGATRAGATPPTRPMPGRGAIPVYGRGAGDRGGVGDGRESDAPAGSDPAAGTAHPGLSLRITETRGDV
ncbi:DUF4255 domain-containing protein [Streptomyces sp. NBC_00872]|uniref:DUF4255 domain-containing protein n=1 Tax=Streptomyces sp. NBC_00872 TaxID=2903686 RepID=UPI00386F74B5|nr:DUF4255 domain-containing protein [Streptomyces sp. NBC_00872]